MEPPPPPPPLTPELAAAKARERRQGLVAAAVGLAGMLGTLGTMVYRHATAPGKPLQAANLGFLASVVVLGVGLHRALWAPRGDAAGIPRPVRPWLTVLLTLSTWWLLAQIAGLVSGALAGGR